jgi:cell division protein FtsB
MPSLTDASKPPRTGRDFPKSSDSVRLSARQIDGILPSAFWFPGWNFASSRAEHLPFYFWLIDVARPHLIVDLAAGKPDDYLAFCQSVERLNYGATCLGAADIFDKRGSDNGPNLLREYHDMHFGHLSRLTDEAGQIFDPSNSPPIDLLHIDGRQASELSESDVQAWLERLSPHGLIMIDQPEHLGSSWWGFLERRASLIINGRHNVQLSAANAGDYSKLSPLFNNAGDDAVATSMRNIFMRLGSALRDHALHRDLARFATRLEISLADQSAMTDLLRDEKTALETELKRQASERDGLVVRNGMLERQIEQFQSERDGLVARTAMLERQIEQFQSERDGLVARTAMLERQIEQFQSERDGLVARTAMLERQIERFQIEVARLQENATHAQALRHESEVEISRLQRVIADRDTELRSAIAGVDSLRHHALRLENDLNSVLQSTAWKITAPFRALLTNFPGPARVLKQALKLVWWTVSLQLFARLKQLRGSSPHSSAQPALAVDAPLPEGSRHAISDATTEVPPPSTNIEHDSGRIEIIENRIVELASTVDMERQRIDFALLGTDGLLNEVELYHRARAGADYKKVFDETAPLVSVCVATMNRSNLLIERCLNSLVSQSYRNIQIIVVGDHCTDDTGSQIARLRDDRISFHNLPSRGPYPAPGIDRWRVAGTNAINAALSMCEGQFITHLDDDDSAAADRIETMVDAAQHYKADFCWHPFWCERKDGTWCLLGDGRFELGQITTGSIFYHRYFKKFAWNVYAYRTQEPGDWNRLRKIRSLRPNLHFVDRPLIFHYTEGSQPPFVRHNGESFLE